MTLPCFLRFFSSISPLISDLREINCIVTIQEGVPRVSVKPTKVPEFVRTVKEVYPVDDPLIGLTCSDIPSIDLRSKPYSFFCSSTWSLPSRYGPLVCPSLRSSNCLVFLRSGSHSTVILCALCLLLCFWICHVPFLYYFWSLWSRRSVSKYTSHTPMSVTGSGVPIHVFLYSNGRNGRRGSTLILTTFLGWHFPLWWRERLGVLTSRIGL